MKVKICGIKKIEDALSAIKYGADAIGLLVGQMHNSTDFIDKDAAKNIVDQLPPFCSSVLVTHLLDCHEIIELAKYINVTTIQLHGDSTPDDVVNIKKQLPYIKIVKSLHVINLESVELGKKYLPVVDAILLDTINKSTNQVGGTGLTHDWNLSKQIVESYTVPVILAGGLNPNNVKDAVETVNPYGVDINSGVKGSDGFKSDDKLKSFIRRAKNIND